MSYTYNDYWLATDLNVEHFVLYNYNGLTSLFYYALEVAY